MERMCLKILSIVASIITLYSCNTKKITTSITDVYPYKVVKIDSLNSFYIIYISKENEIYKVVSEKTFSNCKKIQVNESYPVFMFTPLINESDYIPKNKPANYLDFVPRSIKLNDSTVVERDMGADNIYKTSNLSGLCYIDFLPKLKIKK